jgi:hypothetical protein
MGFFDKLKSAANFVTGGAAKVVIEYNPQFAFPGEPVGVRVTVTSTGPAIQGSGIFVDVQANEMLNIAANVLGNNNPHISHTKQTYHHAFPIAGAFQLGPNETKMFEGQFVLPPNAQPTYDGPLADHDWGMRGRVEMSGNDPDSGFVKFQVGKRA